MPPSSTRDKSIASVSLKGDYSLFIRLGAEEVLCSWEPREIIFPGFPGH